MHIIRILSFLTVIINVKCNFFKFKAVQIFLESSLKFSVSEKCAQHLDEFRYDLLYPGKDAWAVKMLDATSKMQAGLFNLNIGEMGNFEECINTRGVSRNSEPITTKYCLGNIDVAAEEVEQYSDYIDDSLMKQLGVKKKSSIITNLIHASNASKILGPRWAMCAPSSCTTKDLNEIMRAAFQEFFSMKTTIKFTDDFCQTEEDVNPTWTSGAIATMSLLGIYIAFVCGATAHDVYMTRLDEPDKRPNKILQAFSLYTNTGKIFTIGVPSEDVLSIPCLDGIRFISIMWVVLGHQYSINSAGPLSNTAALIPWSASMFSMFVTSGTMAVDTFLVVGSTLTVIAYLKIHKSYGHVPFDKYIIHRYIRLTPPLAAMVLVSATLIRYAGSGPMWQQLYSWFQLNCETNWWSTLFYIQNYANVENLCVGHSWYLAVDMQLYCLAFLLFLGIIKTPRIILSLFASAAVLSMLWSFWASWNYKITALLTNYYGKPEDFNNHYYLLTHTRAAPWCIGVIFGYFVYQIKEKKMKMEMTTLYSYLGWLVCICVQIFCVVIGHGSLHKEEYSRWGNALYLTFVRPIWSLTVCYVIFACAVDTANTLPTHTVKKILELPVFKVLNRLTYCLYLTHVTFMYMIMFARKAPEYFSDFDMVFKFWGSFCSSLILALVWTLLFESPTMALEKLLLAAEAPDFRSMVRQVLLRREDRPTAEATEESDENQMEDIDLHDTESPPSSPRASPNASPERTEEAEEICETSF